MDIFQFLSTWYPLIVLLIGIVTVIGLIIVAKVNAFVALITSAMLVSLLSPGPLAERVSRVADAFGSATGKIGIVIAMAAIIGKCLMDSGAADRIVRSLLRILGEKRAPLALLSSGFILSIPVFFDTVFYLLVPLARSLWRSTHKNYMMYILSIGAGAAITHTLVPPTPGPLLMAAEFHVHPGTMMLGGGLVGLATALVIIPVCSLMNRMIDLPMRPYSGEEEMEPLPDTHLPPLWLSLMPIALPVVMISTDTVTKFLEARFEGNQAIATASTYTSLLGNANLALLVAGVVSMFILMHYRNLTFTQLAKTSETALMSGGVIILITAGGGAFGAMLREAGISDSIEQLMGTDGQSLGLFMLALGFGIACVMKIAQGSSTVAMIVTAGMMASMASSDPEAVFDSLKSMLGCHPVYLCTAIGAGSLVGSWMNDSGFWIFSRMSGLTEIETLKSWSVILVIIGLVAFGFSLLFASILPLA